MFAPVKEPSHLLARFISEQTEGGGDAVGQKHLSPLATNGGIRVFMGDEHLADTSPHQRLRAGWSTTKVIAGFEGDVSR